MPMMNECYRNSCRHSLAALSFIFSGTVLLRFEILVCLEGMGCLELEIYRRDDVITSFSASWTESMIATCSFQVRTAPAIPTIGHCAPAVLPRWIHATEVACSTGDIYLVDISIPAALVRADEHLRIRR